MARALPAIPKLGRRKEEEDEEEGVGLGADTQPSIVEVGTARCSHRKGVPSSRRRDPLHSTPPPLPDVSAGPSNHNLTKDPPAPFPSWPAAPPESRGRPMRLQFTELPENNARHTQHAAASCMFGLGFIFKVNDSLELSVIFVPLVLADQTPMVEVVLSSSLFNPLRRD